MKKIVHVTLLVVFTCLFISCHSMHASATDQDALNSMPSGISVTKDIFSVPTTLSNGSNSNSSFVNSGNTSNSSTEGIQITDDVSNQLGAVWSNSSNKIDLSKSFTASMWLYFGNKGDNAGDGMAFVLQNSGSNAISGDGQSLGAWGMDNKPSYSTSPSTVAETAIQKSWALEFDEYTNADNKNPGANGDFDNGISGQHIASNYPGESSSYYQNGTGTYQTSSYPIISMHHEGLISTNLSDGKWHHLTLTWQAPTSGNSTGKMTYTFNDKDPNTGMKDKTSSQSQTVSIDITKLGLDAASTDKSVYWGFTGATGGNSANNMVVFENVPGLVDAENTLSIKDNTTNTNISDGDKVYGGDDLTYTYNLKYLSGRADWKSIVTKLTQDNNITFSSGKIDFKNGDTESLSSTELTNTEAITHSLKDSLGNSNNTATITLKGKAKDVTSETKVASVNQYFNGSDFIGSVETPSFLIEKKIKRDIHVQLLKSKVSVAPGKSVNLAGVVLSGDTGSDQTDWKNSDFTVHVTLDDGEKIDDFTLNGEKDNSSEEGYFNLDLPANKLKAGANQVSFYVTDKYGNQSKSVTATVNLQGTVQLSSVSKSISFVSTEVPTEETLVKPSGTWEVNVDDNLVSGQAWSVYATASTMQSGSHTLKGNTVYVDDTGSKHMMTNQSTLVGSGKSTGTQQTTNIAKSWSNKEGIFLDVQPGVYAGQYTGTIDWSIEYVP